MTFCSEIKGSAVATPSQETAAYTISSFKSQPGMSQNWSHLCIEIEHVTEPLDL